MSLSDEPIIPSDPPKPEAPKPVAPARRRRAARAAMFPKDAEGQAALVAALSRRAYPTLELFVFSLVCGAIVGFGFLLDSQAVLLLGILVTPIMTPWVGFLLSIYIGAPRFLFETLRALLVSAAIIFIGGLMSGFAARLFLPATFNNVFIHARLWIAELVVLAVAAGTLVASFARSEDKPFLPSILIAYGFYLPINASGFGLGSGIEGIWPQGLYVFIAHFALATLIGLITLFALQLKPTKAGGIASGITIVALILILIWLMFPQLGAGILYPSPTQTPTLMPALPLPVEPSATSAIFAPVESPTLPPTLPPTLSPTAKPASADTPTASNTPAATATKAPTQTTAATSTKAASATPSPTRAFTSTPAASATSAKSATGTASATFTALAQPSQTPAVTATVKPNATATPTITPQPIIGRIDAGESGGANLRQTPNGKYITTLLNDSEVEVSLEKRVVNGVEWLRVFAVVKGERLEGWLLASVVVYQNVTPSP